MATPAIFLAASALILAVLFRPRFFVRRRNLAVLGEELAAASRLGIPLQRVLRAFASRRWKRDAQAAQRVAQRLDDGLALSASAAGEPRLFPHPAALFLAAGERTGNLPEALSGAARWAWDDLTARGQWILFLWYPFLLGLAFSGIMPDSVLPRIAEILNAVETPARTPVPGAAFSRVMFLEFRLVFGWIPLGAALLLAAWKILERYSAFAGCLGRFRLALPVVGCFERRAGLERVALVLGMASKSGAGLPDALRASADAVSNPAHAEALRKAARETEEGRTLDQALAETGRFPESFAWRAGVVARSADPASAFAGLAKGLREERIRSLRRLLWAGAAATVIVVGIHVGILEYWIFQSIAYIRGIAA